MLERFARTARDAVRRAIAEAGRRGDRKVATDHLLIGLLHDPAIARQVGADAATARRTADQIDREALLAVGVEPDAFGPLAAGPQPEKLPFTPGTKQALKRALAHTIAAKARRIEPRHLLHALLERDAPDPAAAILTRLHIDEP
jgi:ATP-dependent Clp protease ATP-binding subunit ClpA